jgi:S-adenosylmethionine:tRNA ribosyltransferase-isomerase
MRIEDFDFELPQELIAQAPLPERDASRLLALDRVTGATRQLGFRELPSLLREGDLLVLNDARVIPARLVGQKEGTGGRAELLLLRPADQRAPSEALPQAADALEWICLGQASKGFKPMARLAFAGGLKATITQVLGGGEYRVRFEAEAGEALGELLQRAGRLPLPPYIERDPDAADAERYQTVYATSQGSVAAPTAGLHFTPGLLEALARAGISHVKVTLDVGAGTFLPVRDGDIGKHKMHQERFSVPPETAEAVNRARAEGRRVVAVGTTVVRTLESATDPETFRLKAGSGDTALFIQPGFTFRQVDALVTNFHLPRSTLLMLVSAFGGREAVLAAYRDAVARGYRFFSYGDAMFLGEVR